MPVVLEKIIARFRNPLKLNGVHHNGGTVMTTAQRIRLKAIKIEGADLERIRKNFSQRRSEIQAKGGYKALAKESVINKLSDEELRQILEGI